MSFALTGGLVLLVYWGSAQVISLFVTNPEVSQLGQELLNIMTWAVAMFGAGQVFAGVMRASGDVIAPLPLVVTAIFAVELPVALCLSGTIGLKGIWWGYVAGFGTMTVLQATYFYFYWRKKAVVALV